MCVWGGGTDSLCVCVCVRVRAHAHARAGAVLSETEVERGGKGCIQQWGAPVVAQPGSPALQECQLHHAPHCMRQLGEHCMPQHIILVVRPHTGSACALALRFCFGSPSSVHPLVQHGSAASCTALHAAHPTYHTTGLLIFPNEPPIQQPPAAAVAATRKTRSKSPSASPVEAPVPLLVTAAAVGRAATAFQTTLTLSHFCRFGSRRVSAPAPGCAYQTHIAPPRASSLPSTHLQLCFSPACIFPTHIYGPLAATEDADSRTASGTLPGQPVGLSARAGRETRE